MTTDPTLKVLVCNQDEATIKAQFEKIQDKRSKVLTVDKLLTE